MAPRTRVLHVIQNLNYGGMERLLVDIVGRADPRRFEPHVMVLQYFGRYAEDLRSSAVLHLAPRMSRWSLVRPTALARRIARIAPSVVHTHSGVWYKASLAARLAGVPRLIHTEHGRHSPDPIPARLLDGLAARRTDVVVAVSEALATHLALAIVPDRRRIRVVPNGVDPDRFRPRADSGAVRAELGIAPDVPIIGSIGRLEYVKGYDVMIQAFARLRAWHSIRPAPVLVVGGHGAERPRLEALARDAGVSDSVHLLGWRDDVHDLHSAFTVFTMSSRSEGTSLSLLEAMSAGLCPVVTRVGGNAAVLGDGLDHRMVPVEEPEALAFVWHDALAGGERRAADAATARARVVEAFSADAMVREYEALYEGAPRGGERTASRPPFDSVSSGQEGTREMRASVR